MKNKLTFLFLFITCLIAHGQDNVILITLDGFRWQEVFTGADTALMRQQAHLKDDKLKEKYWSTDPAQRRKLLLPFFWNTIAVSGQIAGNRLLNSNVNVTNKMWFSYPGYNEILTGKADDEKVNSNDKKYNQNTTILEFLNSQKEIKGKVASFTSWDCFPYIINDKRSGVFVSAALTPATGPKLSDREKTLNQLLNTIPNPLGDVRLDAFTFYYGLEYMKKNKPRVMYFSFDETDDFAHSGEYGAYLNSAHYTDAFIAELWNYVQSDDFYKGKTTLIITTDHGRGNNSEDWKHHGIKIKDADQIWIAAIGPKVKAQGELKDIQLYQNQIAKTIGKWMGYDFITKDGGSEIKQWTVK